MADRCYLENRDRLYPEFVLGGIAMPSDASARLGALQLRARRAAARRNSSTCAARASTASSAPYRYLESLFNGRNPYMDAIQRNLDYLEEVLRTGRWPMLRRDPPLHLGAQPGAEHPLAGHRPPEAGVEEQLIIRLGAARSRSGCSSASNANAARDKDRDGQLQASAPSL